MTASAQNNGISKLAQQLQAPRLQQEKFVQRVVQKDKDYFVKLLESEFGMTPEKAQEIVRGFFERTHYKRIADTFVNDILYRHNQTHMSQYEQARTFLVMQLYANSQQSDLQKFFTLTRATTAVEKQNVLLQASLKPQLISAAYRKYLNDDYAQKLGLALAATVSLEEESAPLLQSIPQESWERESVERVTTESIDTTNKIEAPREITKRKKGNTINRQLAAGNYTLPPNADTIKTPYEIRQTRNPQIKSSGKPSASQFAKLSKKTAAGVGIGALISAFLASFSSSADAFF